MAVNLINTDYKWGFHVSKCNPSLLCTFEKHMTLPFSCFQIYISSRSWVLPEYSNIDLLKTRDLLKSTITTYLCIHGCLLYNLAGSVRPKDPILSSKLANVRKFLTRELDIGAVLGAGVVVHPGSCKNRDFGIRTIAESVTHCLTVDTDKAKSLAESMGISISEFKKKRKIILENAAGEGTKLAVTLDEIASIIKLVPKELHSQVKVCIDTAHAFGAGLYRWGDPKEVRRFYSDFDRIIGLSYLEVFHLNDSRCSEKKSQDAPFGSKKDRHEYLGQGYIFGFKESNLEGLREFFTQARKRAIPIIGEPPGRDRQGNPGGGYLQEWKFGSNLLSVTDVPLIE